MKRVSVILVMLLYLIPAVGVTVSVHICDGAIKSASFNPFDSDHRCSCGSKKMKKDCCKDETASIKLEEDQQKKQFVSYGLAKVVDLRTTFSNKPTFYCQTQLLSSEFDYGLHPPDDVKHPVYIRHRVFQI